ncbi:hypothetical protein, partial [Zavarzinella formosa]|uniref:hypothetical protein n=1 Tax=Zavarzinella formosa TaxID=360055 RepID=UPI00187D89C2
NEAATINALTVGGAVAVGAGGAGGVGVGGAGAGSGNTVKNTVQASVSGQATVTTTGGDVSMTAKDQSGITADGGGISVGVAAGTGGGVGASLGVGYANNDIRNTVQAFVDNSDVTSAGKVAMSADESATIKALSIAGTVAVGAGTGGIAAAGAGAGSYNSVHGIVQADVANGAGKTVAANGGSVTISATDHSTINASAGGVAAGVGAGGAVGVGVTVGASTVNNDVGNQVQAFVDGALVKAAGGDVSLNAAETTNISGLAIGGAASGSGGVLAGVSASGAGAEVDNNIANNVAAYATNGATLKTTGSGNVSILASDSSTADAKAIAGALAAGFSIGGAGAIAIGASIASNTFNSTIQAYGDSSTVSSAGGVTMQATSASSGTTLGVAASVAVAGAPAGLSFSGGGASSTNRVTNTVKSFVDGGAITAAGDVLISSLETSPLSAKVGTGAIAGGLVAASVSVSAADNTSASQVQSTVNNATVTTPGNVRINSSTGGTADTLSIATSVAVGFGGAGAGATASSNLGDSVEASTGFNATINAGQDVEIAADSNQTGNASTDGIAVGAIAVGVSIAHALMQGAVKAKAEGQTKSGKNLKIRGTSEGASAATAKALVGGIYVGYGSEAIASDSPAITSTLTGTTQAGGDVTVEAVAQPKASADSKGISASGITIGLSTSQSTVAPTVAATGGGQITVPNGGLTVNALVDGLSNSAHSNASGGAILATINGAQSDAVSGPVVSANLGSGAQITTGKDVNVTANSTGSTTAKTDGLNIGGFVAASRNVANAAIGTANLDGIVSVPSVPASTSAFAGDQASVNSGGSLTISANNSQKATSNATGSIGGLIAIGGAQATTVRNNPVSANAQQNSSLNADRDVTITATNGYDPFGTALGIPVYGDNLAAVANNTFGGLGAAGKPTASTTVADGTDAELGDHAQVNARKGSFTLQAITKDFGVRSSATAKGGGAVAVPIANATTTTNDPATVTVGSAAGVKAGMNILVESRIGVNDSSDSSTSGKGLGVDSTATSKTDGTANASTLIKDHASLAAGLNMQILADQKDGVLSSSTATATGGAAGLHVAGTTTIDKTNTSNVDVQPSATLNAVGSLQLDAATGASSGSLADLFVFGATSHAITDAGGFAGKTDANATTNLTTQANVNVEKASAGSATTTMRTSNLQVTSHNNSLPVTTKAERKGFVLIDVGSSKKKETVSPSSSVAMYANATITGASGYLHIDPTGNVTSSGVTYTTVGNQIVLDPIVNPGNGSALISAKGGVTGIQGNSTFMFDQGSGSVDLLNEDPTKDLVVGDISVLNSHTTPKLTIDALFLPPGSSFTTNISNTGGTPVSITSVSNIVLRGTINNAEGSVTVNAPNGSITGAGNQLISSQQVTLAGNSIGTAASRLNVQTVQWNGAPVLSANATGNIYLNLSATNMQNTDPVSVNNATFNAPLVDLLIADSGAGSAYSLGVITGELNVDAGVSTPVDLSITATGDLPVGSVISRRGNVRLTAGGAIITKRPGGATDLIGNNLTLVAGTTIGAASPLAIVSSFTAPGVVNASAAGDINLRQVTGNLSLNQVKSATGNISLQSAGRLIDGRSGVGSPPDAVEAPTGKALLSAGLGIGSQTQNLVTKVAYLEAEAGLGELFVNNIGTNLIIGGGGAISGVNGATVNVVTAGDLTVNENSVASGLIAMTAGSITISGGVAVRSDNSSVTLSASGGLEIKTNSHVAAGGAVVLRSTGNGDFNLLNINGLISGSSVQTSTGSGTGDAIYFNQVPVGIPVIVDGGAGNLDTLDITGTNGDDTYTVTGNTITLSNGTSFTYSNIEVIRVHSLAGNDTFNVSGSSASVSTQLLAGGRSTLNLTTNGVLNSLVDYQGGTGPNVVNVTTNSIPTGSGNPNVLVTDSGQINGLGLQATLAHVTAMNVNLNNDGTQFHLMGSQAPTVVQANGHNQKISLGGDPAPVPVLSGGTAIQKDFGESGNINAFGKSVTLSSVAGSGNTLSIDNSDGTATQAVLTANAVKGLGEAQGADLKFNGIDSLDLSAGKGDLTVKNTIAGPVAIEMAANSEARPGTLTVLSSAASALTLSGGGSYNNVVFDASSQTTPITAALTDGAAAGSTKLTGFGPISPTTFAGFTEADLLEGSNSDTLSLSSSVPTTLIHVNGGAGSDQFIVGRVAVSPDSLTMPNTMILSGDSGDDKVNVIVSGNPGDSVNQGLLYLSSAVEHMEVDNSANPNPVNWTTNSGATVGYVVNNVETPLVEMSLVDDVNIIGGTSPQNTLNVNAGGTAQKGTINGNQVTLQSSGLLQFTRLQGTVASYVEGGFTLRSTTMDNQPNLEADRSILPAIKAANPAANAPVVFTATDGGLFSLYSIDFSGTGTTTLIGTTATGKTVTQQITVSSPGAFQTVTLDPKFSELTSVSLILGNLSMTKLVAIQTLHTGIELPIAAVPGTMPSVPQNIEIGSGSGSINIDGHPIPIYTIDSSGFPIYFFGVFNGTPFAITNNFLDNNAINTIYFYGDLNIPAGSTVTIDSNQPFGFVVQNDVNIGDGVTFNVPPGVNPASQGGQGGTAFASSGRAGGGGPANGFGLGSNGLLYNAPGEVGGSGFYGFQGQNAAATYSSSDWRTAQGGLGGNGFPNGSGGFTAAGSGGSGGSWGPNRENADGSPLFGVGEDGGDGVDGGNGQNGTAGLSGLPGQTGFVSSSNDLV